MDKICVGCYYNKGWCNRLVASSIGMKDRVASDYIKDNTCDYRNEGESKEENKPNFENT